MVLFFASARKRSLFVYHLHMGGPDATALEWKALFSPRFEPRVRHMGVTHVDSVAGADVVVVTGLLTTRNVDAVLAELNTMPVPSVLIAAGDSTYPITSPSGSTNDELQITDQTQVIRNSMSLRTSGYPLGVGAQRRSNWSAAPSHPLTYYLDVQISIPGNPPTPQALIAALAAAAKLLSQPLQPLAQWQED